MLGYGRPIVIEPVHFGSSLFLTTALRGEIEIEANGTAYQGRPGTTVLTAVKLHLDRTRVEALCWQSLGTLGREPLRFHSPLGNSRFLERWLALLVFLISNVGSERSMDVGNSSVPGGERLIASVEETVMLTLLHGQPHNYSSRLAGNAYAIAPRQWRRAVAFMEANISCALTLMEIASAAGCSIRSLTRAFRDYGDTSPMRCTNSREPARQTSPLLRW